MYTDDEMEGQSVKSYTADETEQETEEEHHTLTDQESIENYEESEEEDRNPCAALACLSHKEFGTCHTICINTNVFFISVRDIVRFDNDTIVGKASDNSRDVGLRVLKVHESR